MKTKNKKGKEKKKNEAEEDQIFKMPEGNTAGKVDVSNPAAVRQNLQDILKAPVSQPIGNNRELKPSSTLGKPSSTSGPKQDKRKETQPKEQDQQKQKKGEQKRAPKRKTEEEEEAEEKSKKTEKKKMVFTDRKDYIQHQIKVLKERADKQDKNISAHRYAKRQEERTEDKD